MEDIVGVENLNVDTSVADADALHPNPNRNPNRNPLYH
jgi:hypothetical protein